MPRSPRKPYKPSAHELYIARRLTVAKERTGMKLHEIRDASGLTCSIVSISRKLSGRQPISDRELEKIAKALGETVTVTRRVVELGVPRTEAA